ncbi:Uncaracterized surface protein containing fasciclin (FAS1) repeats [Nocardioides alpinus]|uniref:Beta-Ig-H3/fasciclin n=1 Tax=Nocardioides alpinus TaxID=748909 RepID=A0A1I0WJF1_9ACTN|nr:fasciclin domain-containing protein [Nocardioides alpinus]PKH37949.1 beta-Ig-H3/fasciclin [Nocardioides alpinus]SFA88358.1 Uncaracterized surface protein containing fasciclin (FAS1) repeats [Nocardioides alpinus]
MNTKLRTRTLGLAALALTASMSLAACGSESDTDSAAEPTTSETPMESEAPAEEPMESETPAADGPFGPGCAGVPTEGEGSVEGMLDDPVATAASNNPLLKTLVAAVTEAGLVDTLNSADALTVFAPTDDAFAKIAKKDLNALLADKEMLTTVLTHHVVAGKLSPEDVAGEHETLAGDTLTVEGSGEDFTIGDAAVVCGNVSTANATVYVVDSVLMPEM